MLSSDLDSNFSSIIHDDNDDDVVDDDNDDDDENDVDDDDDYDDYLTKQFGCILWPRAEIERFQLKG